MTAPLVALPGTLCPPSVFDPLAAHLVGEVELRACSWLTGPPPWDVPSLAAALARRLRTEHAGPVLVAGHSTGGAIALQLALDAPEVVAGLLLVDTGASMAGHGDVDAVLHRVATAWGEPLWRALLERSLGAPVPPVVLAEALAWCAGVDARAARDVLASQRDLDLRPRLAEVAVPAVVLHGLRDPARSVAAAHELAEGVPGARLRLVDAGHTPVFDAPAAAAAAVRELVELVATARRGC